MSSTSKRRSIPFSGWTGVAKTTYSNDPGRVDIFPINGGVPNKATGLQGIQFTESENHPIWKDDKSFKGDVGGNFFTQKKYTIPDSVEIVRLSGVQDNSPPAGRTFTTTYTGPLLPIGPSQMPFPNANNSSNSLLEAWGTKAIALCKPTNQVASLAQALIETYRDGLPKLFGVSLWKDRTRAARGVGSEYLNYEFGWVPLANDISKFAGAVANFDRYLRQYEKDAGKVVRRRLNFPPEETLSESTIQSPTSPYTDPSVSAIGIPHFSVSGKVVRVRKTYVRRWFSGAFTYHIPIFSKGMGTHASLAAKILGVEPTPDLIWSVAPWSWAVDWFSTAGDVISNMSDAIADGLVLRYGYIMEHSFVQDEYVFTGPTGLQTGGVRPQPITVVTETKIRRRATPFGFGLLFSGFTARQKAIIAALGLTRGK